MKIYIDVSVLTLATFVTGIQRVTREIIIRLLETRQEDVVLLHYNARDNVYHRIDNTMFFEYYRHGTGVKNKMITGQKIELPDMKKGSVFFDLDAAWMCRVKRSWLLPILKKQGVRIVAHIYDIISVTHPQYCLERGVYNFMDFIGAHLLYADDIIVNAGATVTELQKLADTLQIPLPACHVVPLGADFSKKAEVGDEQVPAELKQAVRSGPYLLMVGTIEPRKNHKLVLEAYDQGLKQMGYHVIFAGYMGWNMETFEEQLKKHPDFEKGIFHFEGLDDKGITYLYQNAKFLAFCSYTEGFGLPIIESILRGTPVIAADIPVSREVGGDYPQWFPQDDAGALCRIVERYTEDPGEYDRWKARLTKYRPATWEDCSRQVQEILEA